eukprot:2436871-Rhodomonas_salina.2
MPPCTADPAVFLPALLCAGHILCRTPFQPSTCSCFSMCTRFKIELQFAAPRHTDVPDDHNVAFCVPATCSSSKSSALVGRAH